SKEATKSGWFHTGDWGYVDEEGYLYILDRRNDLIVSGGENIYPAEIEAALLSHPAILEAGVTGLPDDRWGQTPVAVIILRQGHSVTEQQLFEFLALRLARYKLPSRILFTDSLPRTASGKLQRHRLAELFIEE